MADVNVLWCANKFGCVLQTISVLDSTAPSSPVHSRRMLTARVGRMSSVELPDEPDKSLSSNSASPCPSPVKQMSVSIFLLL